jgi:hypothetical protein
MLRPVETRIHVVPAFPCGKPLPRDDEHARA